jgi:hypothetical protein
MRVRYPALVRWLAMISAIGAQSSMMRMLTLVGMV